MEVKVANWFQNEYGIGIWKNWHVTDSRIPGLTANNNLEESFKRDAKRGVSTKTDTVGVYITETMPREIANWSRDLGSKAAGPIVYTIPCSPNRHIIQKALQIITHGVDYQLDEIEVCNYYRVTDSLKLTKGRNSIVNTFNGYVINDTESLYQNDMDYAMTLERAKVFCLSIEGIFNPTLNFHQAIECCLKSHAVRITAATTTSRHPLLAEHSVSPAGFMNDYVCDCKGYWHKLICSHVLAAMHLNKDIDLHVMTRLIERPCTVGRPGKSRKPIGAATHVADEPVLTIHEAAKWIGSRLSCKMPADGRVYAGTIHAVYEGRDHNMWGGRSTHIST